MMGWGHGQPACAAGGSKGAYHHAWAVDRTPCGATLAAIVLSLERLVGIGLGKRCLYVLPWRNTCTARDNDVPCTSWWCRKRHSRAAVVAGLSGFELGWPRAPMSCDLGCVGKWVGGDSDCGGVVGGRKCGRRRLAACTGAPRSKCDGKRKWQVRSRYR